MVGGEAKIRLGAHVSSRDGPSTERWRTVAAYEADALRRLMSEEPLLARVLGHVVGDVVTVRSPRIAPLHVKILDVG
jgi:transcription elongation GreA/GreB family factor